VYVSTAGTRLMGCVSGALSGKDTDHIVFIAPSRGKVNIGCATATVDGRSIMSWAKIVASTGCFGVVKVVASPRASGSIYLSKRM
jgi:hypothetical protein